MRLAALVRTEGEALPVRLVDLSLGGARGEAHRPPAAGTRVTLARERMEVAARVVWARGGRFGLVFETPIRATELFYQLGRSRET